MKLATLKSDSPDGTLVVVSSDNKRCVSAKHIMPNLLAASESWDAVKAQLSDLFEALNDGKASEATSFNPLAARAPLPRSWQWLDGSAFPEHGHLMQKAYNLPPIESNKPLMYQGMSDRFYGPSDDVPFTAEDGGIDFEGEFGIIVDAVPMGTSAKDAMAHIKLIVQLNDWSLRNGCLRDGVLRGGALSYVLGRKIRALGGFSGLRHRRRYRAYELIIPGRFRQVALDSKRLQLLPQPVIIYR